MAEEGEMGRACNAKMMHGRRTCGMYRWMLSHLGASPSTATRAEAYEQRSIEEHAWILTYIEEQIQYMIHELSTYLPFPFPISDLAIW